MLVSNSVKSFQAATQLQLLNFTALGKNFEVSVNGSKADAGHPFTNHFIDFISAWMGSDALKRFQNDLTLTCHPEI
jgi:hypothetical protein